MSDDPGSSDVPADLADVRTMPFITVTANGGPHDTESFSCGYECGFLDGALSALDTRVKGLRQIVHTVSVEQCDLIAMKHGFTMTSTDRGDGWSFIDVLRVSPHPPVGEQIVPNVAAVPAAAGRDFDLGQVLSLMTTQRRVLAGVSRWMAANPALAAVPGADLVAGATRDVLTAGELMLDGPAAAEPAPPIFPNVDIDGG